MAKSDNTKNTTGEDQKPPVSAPTVTREVNTNPTAPSAIVNVKITGDVLPMGYGCDIGSVYPFARHMADYIVQQGLGVIEK